MWEALRLWGHRKAGRILVGFTRYTPVDVGESAAMLARVAERLKDLQFYDGEGRLERFEKDGEAGGAAVDSFWNVIGVDPAG